MWEMVAWRHQWGPWDLMGNGGHYWDSRGAGQVRVGPCASVSRDVQVRAWIQARVPGHVYLCTAPFKSVPV